MAKKTTKQRKAITQQRAIQQAAANVNMTAVGVSAPVAAPQASATTRQPLQIADEHEYAFVRADLKRILILATALIVVLIALSLVIK